MKKTSIKVLIADDHALMRQGLKQILELDEDIEVVGLAVNGEEAILMEKQLEPDVILLDINMPKMNGVQALRRLKDIGTKSKVVMLTIHEDKEYLYETINIGASGYVLKDAESSSLIKAIKDVHNGESYIHPSLVSALIKRFNKSTKIDDDDKQSRLTRREYEVLTLIAEGRNNKEIAEELFISEKTVKNHISSIFKKIEVNDRTQAAIYAYKHNIKRI